MCITGACAECTFSPGLLRNLAHGSKPIRLMFVQGQNANYFLTSWQNLRKTNRIHSDAGCNIPCCSSVCVTSVHRLDCANKTCAWKREEGVLKMDGGYVQYCSLVTSLYIWAAAFLSSVLVTGVKKRKQKDKYIYKYIYYSDLLSPGIVVCFHSQRR